MISFYIFFYKNKSILNLLGLTHSIRNLSGRIMFHNFDIYKIYFDFKSVFQTKKIKLIFLNEFIRIYHNYIYKKKKTKINVFSTETLFLQKLK
jgi:hypothetical protein